MRKPHIIIILLTVLSMTSCNRGHGPDKQFLENESITLTIGGREKIKCSLKYTDGGIAVYKTGMQFEVQKIDDEGRVWLWCKKRSTGITAKILR